MFWSQDIKGSGRYFLRSGLVFSWLFTASGFPCCSFTLKKFGKKKQQSCVFFKLLKLAGNVSNAVKERCEAGPIFRRGHECKWDQGLFNVLHDIVNEQGCVCDRIYRCMANTTRWVLGAEPSCDALEPQYRRQTAGQEMTCATAEGEKKDREVAMWQPNKNVCKKIIPTMSGHVWPLLLPEKGWALQSISTPNQLQIRGKHR